MSNHTDSQRRRKIEQKKSYVRQTGMPERRFDVSAGPERGNQEPVDYKLSNEDQEEQLGQPTLPSRVESTSGPHVQQKPSEFTCFKQAKPTTRTGIRALALPLLASLTLALGLGGAAIAAAGDSPPKSTAVSNPAPVPLILIDPGHGGTNSGAPSVRPDIFEKHITLAMAGVLRARLVAKGFHVRLTRHKDTYLTLRERGRLANEMDADLFVSLHANATESHSHSGYETFILTPDAVDIDSRALRHDSGRPRPTLDPALAAMLDDIERSTSQVAAAELAASIQANLRVLRGKAGDRGVRQDSMHVLLGATMPAVLVEVGFIDHPIEGEQLMDAKVRASMVDAIADAIIKHAPELVRK